MLGQDVVRAARESEHDAVALTHADLDITDRLRVASTIADADADVVINCAAYTAVDRAESDAETALAINAAGAANVAAASSGAWIIHVSTDYVFDGTKTAGAYLESDRTNPRSVYGETKLAGELAVAAATYRHTIVRTSWLFGTGGACFPATMLRLAAERDALQVVADQRGCPTFTPHLAQALISLAESQKLSGTVHVSGSGDCSWHEFAVATVAARADRDTAVIPISTGDYPTAAARPAYSVLRSERGAPTLPHWREGLTAYLEDLRKAVG